MLCCDAVNELFESNDTIDDDDEESSLLEDSCVCWVCCGVVEDVLGVWMNCLIPVCVELVVS